MLPVHQVTIDECLRATVASILELRLEDVPHFAPTDGGGQLREMQKWLRSRGWFYFEHVWRDDNPFVIDCFGHGEYWIATCESTLGPGKSHAFVATAELEDGKCLVRIAHDPAAKRGNKLDLSVHKLDRMGLLVPIDPVKFSYHP